jgi:hypothetical protein
MWGAGFATGTGVGFGLGLVVGSLMIKQKPWSELTEKEKKTRKIAIGVGSFLVLLGLAALVWAVLLR